jgi:pimeloyl-ACP methyl ester carboxylesterase
MFIQGAADIVAAPGDSGSLARDYGALGGGHATYVTIPGGTHLVRLDAISSGADSLFWNQLIDFLDRN